MTVSKVVLAKLSPTMEEGTIVKWNKKEGDTVKVGDVLAEIETDKANMEMEAMGAGVLRKILVPAGGKAPVGTLIGVIAEPERGHRAADRQGGRRRSPRRRPRPRRLRRPRPRSPRQPQAAPQPAAGRRAKAAPAPQPRVRRRAARAAAARRRRPAPARRGAAGAAKAGA